MAQFPGVRSIAGDGTLFVAGIGRQTIDFGNGPVQFPAPTGEGLWLARFTSGGTLVDVREIDDVRARVSVSSTDELFLAGGLFAPVDLGTGPMFIDGGATYYTSFLGRFSSTDALAAWVKGFGSSSPSNAFGDRYIAATSTSVALSASCNGSVEYGGSSPCTTGESVFIRFGNDGAYLSATAHPRGPVATSPPGQFVVAGFGGVTPGAPEKMTLTKFAP